MIVRALIKNFIRCNKAESSKKEKKKYKNEYKEFKSGIK